MGLAFAWQIYQFVAKHVEKGYVENRQRVWKDKVAINPINFSAIIKKLLFVIDKLSFYVKTLCSKAEQWIKRICQSGHYYWNDHQVTVLKVVNLILDFKKALWYQ